MTPRVGDRGGVGRAAWWRDAVVYHVYPRSFADSDGDGIGDLAGITAHLDHLAGAPDSLGVDAVWLSPVYRSPTVDAGYDVADHCVVDPVFGTLADLDALVAAAHSRGLRVVLDLVPNHTSDQHPWFVESRTARTGPRRDFYVWADPAPDGGPPNNWLSAFAAAGPAWTLDPTTGQYYLHSYTPQQPDLNWWHPGVREAVNEVLRFWLRRGVDGFRIDAPHRMIKDRELRDNPPDLAGHRLNAAPAGRDYRNSDRPEVQEVLRGFRAVADEFGAVLLVGEVGVDDPARLAPYYAQGRLDLAFNVSFWRQGWSAAGFRAAVESFEAVLPPGAWPDYALSNHDIPRARSRSTARARCRPRRPGPGSPRCCCSPCGARRSSTTARSSGCATGPSTRATRRPGRTRPVPYADAVGPDAGCRLHHRSAVAAGGRAAAGRDRRRPTGGSGVDAVAAPRPAPAATGLAGTAPGRLPVAPGRGPRRVRLPAYRGRSRRPPGAGARRAQLRRGAGRGAASPGRADRAGSRPGAAELAARAGARRRRGRRRCGRRGAVDGGGQVGGGGGRPVLVLSPYEGVVVDLGDPSVPDRS